MRHCEIGKEAGTYVRVSGTSRSADKAEELCAVIKRYMVEAARTKSDKEKVKDVTVQNLVNWGVLKNIGGALMPTNVFVLLTNNAFPFAKFQCPLFKRFLAFVLKHINLGAEISDAGDNGREIGCYTKCC